MAKTLPTFDPAKGGSQISGEVQWEFNNLVLDRPWHRDQNPVDAPGKEARSSGRSAESEVEPVPSELGRGADFAPERIEDETPCRRHRGARRAARPGSP